ncbi:hypothetical protein TRFO_18376 [Tritrichomonas foetus]|uniref:DUF6602 domain-containing protein n=1 Tax=Tritrichomonas foetus TaxID=1144522 RepID=A0A1J4KL20_9EUKA|nr:hypothetical protein TRFO_18376 [Tritrichomonas foetus]|eukprot:OHT11991.1 hypothetical protein TRFO_18376 [Tritrichomonas foetus]
MKSFSHPKVKSFKRSLFKFPHLFKVINGQSTATQILSEFRMSNENYPNSQSRTLILGCDFPTFHSYWRNYSHTQENDVIGFVYCLPGPPPIQSFRGASHDPIEVFGLDDLENVIQDKHIKKCEIQVSGLSIPQVHSILNRVISTGTCSVEFLPPKEIAIRSFKPLIVISSIAPRIGKTQLTRYFCSVLRSINRKVAIIIPISMIDPMKDIFVVEQGPHYEFKENDPIPPNILSTDDEWQIQQYQKAGAFRIYATSDCRKAIISAEQHSDIILFDAKGCEYPSVEERAKFCVVTEETLQKVRESSLWPGLVNVMSSPNIVYISTETMTPNDKQQQILSRILSHRKIFYAHSKSQFLNSNPDLASEFTNHSFIAIDHKDSQGDATELIKELGASESQIDPSPFLTEGLEVQNKTIVSFIERCMSPTAEIKEKNDEEMAKIVNAVNSSDADVVVVSLQKDLRNFIPDKKVLYITREIQDVGNHLYNWLSQFSPDNNAPPLKRHFEAQVDILMKMAEASDRELFVTNNDSSNREAFCRLFLSSHLPPGFRVTTGEIIDSFSNITGQLDVVIVTDECPRMTIDATASVIAPILADSVLGVVEVKTSLTLESLKKALSQLRPVKALMPTHATLQQPDGTVIQDPLGGKIITGIFAFNPSEKIDQQVFDTVALYPRVADFIVLPEAFGYFYAETLKVCGISVNDADIVNGYVRYTARGMGLAIIFGILNCLAATRKFSGSNCVRYLGGCWGGQAEEITRRAKDTEKYLQSLAPIFTQKADPDLKKQYFQAKNQLMSYLSEVKPGRGRSLSDAQGGPPSRLNQAKSTPPFNGP